MRRGHTRVFLVLRDWLQLTIGPDLSASIVVQGSEPEDIRPEAALGMKHARFNKQHRSRLDSLSESTYARLLRSLYSQRFGCVSPRSRHEQSL